MQPSRDISRLLEIMAALRDPDGGCPWDLAQDFASIRHYTVEEAYEVADAIERKDFDDLREELGDLLLQPVFHAQMASEAGLFDLGDVVQAITEKLIRRHPHVFGETAAARRRRAPRRSMGRRQGGRANQEGGREGGPTEAIGAQRRGAQALPALARAEKLTKRAAKVRSDWRDVDAMTLAKVEEETGRGHAAPSRKSRASRASHEEMGDLLFAIVNLARQLGVDPEAALRDANAKLAIRN